MIYKRHCDTCGKYYEGQGDKYCSRKCQPSPFKGHHHTEENKLILREQHLGKYLSEDHKNKIKDAMQDLKGIPRTPEVCKKIGDAQKGYKNHNYGKYAEESANWKGGKTELIKCIRSNVKCDIWRESVFERDSHTCQKCGKTGIYLHAHHKNQLSVLIEQFNIKSLEDALNCPELWDVNNGVTLCEYCHYEIPKIFVKLSH